MSQFFRRSDRPHLVRAACKPCHVEYQRRYPITSWESLAQGLRKRGAVRLSVVALREALGEPSRCYLCGEDGLTWATAHVDHVVPVASGGGHAFENLRWAHRVCNQVKLDLTLEQLVILARKIVALHGGEDLE